MQLTPARVSSLLAGASALLAALAPAIANLDVTSTAGLFGGAVVIAGILSQFLKGQRAHEARVASFTPPASPMATMNPAATSSTYNVQPIVHATGATDDGDDGDDQLPPELQGRKPHTDIPPDEVNLPHGTVQP